LTSDDVDVNYLQQLMEGYDSSDNQWGRYAFGDSSRGYTRNLVDEGNGKSNLVSDHPNQLSPVETVTDALPGIACSRLVSRKGVTYPRPWKGALLDEDSPWRPDRDSIRFPRKQSTGGGADEGHSRDDIQVGRGGIYV
jgi:hypothetical protein